jgi:LysR family hydrogen peroxide-inducible transcriptional activator
MNTRDLEYLVALSDYRHFGKAAQACFVSQPALSMQIQRLEVVLGVKLLERGNKSVLLTDIGLAITERARHILTQVNEIHDLASLAKDPYSGELRIGIIPTLAPYLLPLIIPPLAQQFTKVHFYLVEDQTAYLMQKLKIGALDAAFLALPVEEPQFITAPLFEEEFLLAVPKGHPLAQQKIVQEKDLKRQNLLLLEEGHCMRGQTLALCHQMQAFEVQNFRATSLETLRQMVATGNGITLMPQLAQQSHDGIVYIPFSPPKPVRSIGLSWRASSVKEVLFTAMVQQIKNIIAQKIAKRLTAII